MIRTPVKPFGFNTLEEFKEYLEKVSTTNNQ
ncbi:hypothetical protein EAMBIBNC_00160 [Citrobacter phage BSwM KMM4]|nr:hypothetical protein EAMBIBNC_00160 [Citrobacter phage BSwM KMM4]